MRPVKKGLGSHFGERRWLLPLRSGARLRGLAWQPGALALELLDPALELLDLTLQLLDLRIRGDGSKRQHAAASTKAFLDFGNCKSGEPNG
jgi:hypothetical protein